MREQADKLLELIRRLIARRFYGRIEIRFEAGRITQIKKEESIKL